MAIANARPRTFNNYYSQVLKEVQYYEAVPFVQKSWKLQRCDIRIYVDGVSYIQDLRFSGTAFFVLAIAHTFLVSRFRRGANRFPAGSIRETLFHFLGEVEVGFGLWATIFVLWIFIAKGVATTESYLSTRSFKEAIFVFMIMSVCSTKPVLNSVAALLQLSSKFVPLPQTVSSYIVLLSIGPLLGSLITESAAMTVVALLLGEKFLRHSNSERFKYATIALLFVNVSIGGTLTPYAAPPVLMVAKRWEWDLLFMLRYFGTSAIAAVCFSTCLSAWWFRKELLAIPSNRGHQKSPADRQVPLWVSVLHLIFLGVLVLVHSKPMILAGVFLLFLAIFFVTRKFQDKLRLREGLMVGFFLSGIIVLGEPQRWWIEPILTSLSASQLYFAAIGLTAITDNAALTYLGSQVPSLSESAKYVLLSGSVVGGGLTVIANAPNPVGISLLDRYFGKQGVSPGRLALWALPFTLIAAISFWWIFPVG